MKSNSLRKLFRKFVRNTYKTFFSKYDVLIELECDGLENLLDVGCGNNSPIHTFSNKLYCVGIDAFEQSIEESKQRMIHREYHKMSVMDIASSFKPKSFDCVVALDVIEHQEKAEGVRLMEMMENIARRKVIVFTPNGFVPQGDRFSNPWQVHLSGWTAQEFKERGYEVTGINGWKPLRGEYAKVRYWPSFLWRFISDVTEIFVKNKPQKAYQLLAVKTLK